MWRRLKLTIKTEPEKIQAVSVHWLMGLTNRTACSPELSNSSCSLNWWGWVRPSLLSRTEYRCALTLLHTAWLSSVSRPAYHYIFSAIIIVWYRPLLYIVQGEQKDMCAWVTHQPGTRGQTNLFLMTAQRAFRRSQLKHHGLLSPHMQFETAP